MFKKIIFLCFKFYQELRQQKNSLFLLLLIREKSSVIGIT